MSQPIPSIETLEIGPHLNAAYEAEQFFYEQRQDELGAFTSLYEEVEREFSLHDIFDAISQPDFNAGVTKLIPPREKSDPLVARNVLPTILDDGTRGITVIDRDSSSGEFIDVGFLPLLHKEPFGQHTLEPAQKAKTLLQYLVGHNEDTQTDWVEADVVSTTILDRVYGLAQAAHSFYKPDSEYESAGSIDTTSPALNEVIRDEVAKHFVYTVKKASPVHKRERAHARDVAAANAKAFRFAVSAVKRALDKDNRAIRIAVPIEGTMPPQSMEVDVRPIDLRRPVTTSPENYEYVGKQALVIGENVNVVYTETGRTVQIPPKLEKDDLTKLFKGTLGVHTNARSQEVRDNDGTFGRTRVDHHRVVRHARRAHQYPGEIKYGTNSIFFSEKFNPERLGNLFTILKDGRAHAQELEAKRS